jgi:hypothetical protein
VTESAVGLTGYRRLVIALDQSTISPQSQYDALLDCPNGLDAEGMLPISPTLKLPRHIFWEGGRLANQIAVSL